ncbi:MAG: type II toxin-antitoxin system PemK/MazF family toxin [Candidatus Liptonbacteria bacterium]|nr:type II toxin-antitoxin system PemK/MazF family toxin [Candidatus Liptonbacteria bacterium]
MMEKDYLRWHTLKSELEKCPIRSPYQEREIWWCSLGANLGTEEDGKNMLFERPVVILRKFNKDMFLGLPLTSKTKEGLYYFSFSFHGANHTAILSQLRALSAKRLVRVFGKMSNNQFSALSRATMSFMDKKTDPLRGPRLPSGNL